MDEAQGQFELGPIRPPSEAGSLLIRVTRNCPWNRCKFCRTYKGEKFELRPVADVKRDILAARAAMDAIQSTGIYPDDMAAFTVGNWLQSGGQTAFLQDANTLIMPVDDLVEIIRFLKETLPTITRITSYGRSKTAAQRTVEQLKRLHEGGLSRIHVGLESGYDPLLAFMDKGATAAGHIKGGRNIVESGISLSEYVVLGLGGVKMSREHAAATAEVLSKINPDYIRLRTLTITADMPLYKEVQSGAFVRLNDEQIVEEERLLIEGLECDSHLVSDHITDLLPEIDGKLPEDKARMLGVIARFQSLGKVEKAVFRMGRRLGTFTTIDDLNDPNLTESVEGVMARLGMSAEKGLDEDVINRLMQRFMS